MIITIFGRMHYAKRYLYIDIIYRHLDLTEDEFTDMSKKMKKYAI